MRGSAKATHVLLCLRAMIFPISVRSLDSNSAGPLPMATLAAIVVSLFVVATVFAVDRFPLSRHWLTQHQSDERA